MPNPENNELSERELDILKLVATGASNKEIARKLFISSNTVKVHLRNIFAKIGASSRTEAAMYAVRIGLADTVSPQLTAKTDDSELIDDSTAMLPQSHSLSDVLNNKLYVRYIGLFGLLIILLIIVIVYWQSNNIETVSQILPTSTPRVQWFELPGLPTPRKGLAVANYENHIYAIGGENDEGICNKVESYDPQTNTWTDHSSKPTSVTDINAAVLGGLIYVPGGRLASGMPTNITEIFDPRTDNWSNGTPLPIPLSAYALTVFEGKIYIFGGWDGNQVIKDAYVYDPHNNSWSKLPSMPTARSYAGAAVVGGKIYVIGGWDGSQSLSVDEVYLPDLTGADSIWAQALSLPSGRYAMGVTNIADIIFVIGGINSEDNLTVIALESGGINWGQIEAPVPNNWSYLGTITVGTRLYALGGSTVDKLNTQMWSYQAIFTIILPIIR